MKTSIDYTQNITFYPDKVVCVSEFIHPTSNNQKKKDVMLENRSTVYNGFMSPATKRRVTKIITVWMEALEFSTPYTSRSEGAKKHYPVFVTLTLSGEQKHDDNFIKRNLLGRFIIELRRNHGVVQYFWRAEKQKNGRIHFHCIFDQYVDMRILQSTWNKIQDTYGYLDEYKKKFSRCNAPSTHVVKIDSSEKAIDYVVKYVSKNPEEMKNKGLKVQGRIWGCSDNIRDLKPYTIAEHSNLIELLNEMHRNNMAERFEDDFFTIYKLNVNELLEMYFPELREKQYLYYAKVFEQLYNPMPILTELSEIEENELTTKIEPAVQLSLFLDHFSVEESSVIDKLNSQH